MNSQSKSSQPESISNILETILGKNDNFLNSDTNKLNTNNNEHRKIDLFTAELQKNLVEMRTERDTIENKKAFYINPNKFERFEALKYPKNNNLITFKGKRKNINKIKEDKIQDENEDKDIREDKDKELQEILEKDILIKDNEINKNINNFNDSDITYESINQNLKPKKKKKKKKRESRPKPDDSYLEEIEYDVEKIETHAYDENENVIKYLIKWYGYSKEENTWEPPEMLDNIKEMLTEYWIKEKHLQNIKGEELTEAEMNEAIKYLPPEKQFIRTKVQSNYPPANWKCSWEEELKDVCIIFKRNSDSPVEVLLKWKHNILTVHKLDDIKEKIPQKLIKYFEEWIVFKDED